jgi:serine/threonine protein phosphatase 1
MIDELQSAGQAPQQYELNQILRTASNTDLRDSRMTLPTNLDYPIIAIADLHGQLEQLKRLVTRLEKIAEWDDCALVFLGDFVDRGEDVRGTIDMVLELLSRRPGGSAVLGNHDLALVRAARLDDGPPSPYWIEHYLHSYDHDQTFLGYLGRRPNHNACQWERELEELNRAIPAAHRAFLVSLPWVVESPGHLFLHCGLSFELRASAAEQLAALHRREWSRSVMKPVLGSATDQKWQPEYPVWIGADKGLSEAPLAFPGKVQVTGHVRVAKADVNPIRIRLDTSGGLGSLTACLLRSKDAEPEFISSKP